MDLAEAPRCQVLSRSKAQFCPRDRSEEVYSFRLIASEKGVLRIEVRGRASIEQHQPIATARVNIGVPLQRVCRQGLQYTSGRPLASCQLHSSQSARTFCRALNRSFSREYCHFRLFIIVCRFLAKMEQSWQIGLQSAAYLSALCLVLIVNLPLSVT